MKSFRDLIVWQKAHKLVLEVYGITKTFPSEERFGLISQVRRSTSSVATNIVEGFKRRSDKEYAYFLNMAEGSLEETKYHLILSYDLGYLKEDKFKNLEVLSDEVGRLLCGLRKKVALALKT
ncbi:MAG: four helix bundle protein [Candidatus Saganbacteria bacterium]|nr:four helix bundle protein [Candidatus Saganbacteria bacterium]